MYTYERILSKFRVVSVNLRTKTSLKLSIHFTQCIYVNKKTQIKNVSYIRTSEFDWVSIEFILGILDAKPVEHGRKDIKVRDQGITLLSNKDIHLLKYLFNSSTNY